MSKKDEALKLALEVLEKCRDGFEFTRQYVGCETLPAIEGWSWYDGDVAAVKAITAVREALAEQPTQRTWVGLTDEETEHLWEISRAAMPRYHTFKTLIEKALRERNT